MLAHVHRLPSWLFVLAAALLTSVCTKDSTTEPPTAPPNFAGIWSGSASDNTGPGTLFLILEQNGASVTGTFEGIDEGTNLRATGNVTGTVSGNALRGQLSGSFAEIGCALALSFTAQVAGVSLSGTYSGTSCTGPVTNGRFTLARSTRALQVITSTSGQNLDPDGYTVVVDGSQSRPIGVNTTVTFANISAGDRSVQLTGIAGSCVVSGANPRTVAVPASGTAQTTFQVGCAALHFMSVSARGGHSCALTVSGAAYCWGKNDTGELGNGTTTSSNTPVRVTGGLAFLSLSTGGAYTCGLTASGVAYCWGHNSYGQLGDGTTSTSTAPVPVAGSLTFTSVTASPNAHTCGVTSSGTAYCWGRNFYGQLGNGATTGLDPNPVPVRVSGQLSFVGISAGSEHTCGLTTSEQAHCWGANASGALGNGTVTDSPTPVAVTGGLTFGSIDAGGFHTCGIAAGRAYCWGLNLVGQLGDESQGRQSVVPVAVARRLNVTYESVDAGGGSGFDHTCGIRQAGEAGGTWCWGHGSAGQLGNGSTANSLFPWAVYEGERFTSVSAGLYHTCAVMAPWGLVYCWGLNETGQLGNGSNVSSSLPVEVSGQR